MCCSQTASLHPQSEPYTEVQLQFVNQLMSIQECETVTKRNRTATKRSLRNQGEKQQENTMMLKRKSPKEAQLSKQSNTNTKWHTMNTNNASGSCEGRVLLHVGAQGPMVTLFVSMVTSMAQHENETPRKKHQQQSPRSCLKLLFKNTYDKKMPAESGTGPLTLLAQRLEPISFWLNVPIFQSHQPQFVSQAFVKKHSVSEPDKDPRSHHLDLCLGLWKRPHTATEDCKHAEQNSSWQVKDESWVKTRGVLFPAAFLINVVYSLNKVQIIHTWIFSPSENVASVQVLILFRVEHKKFELKSLSSVQEADEKALCDTLLCLTIRGL